MVELSDIKAARENIADFVHRTPLLSSQALNTLTGKNIWFKAECFQKTGSFKARGASNKMKALAAQGVKGVITISSGNHGQATAYAAARCGIKAVIMVPDSTSQPKIDAARAYGAEVIVGGDLNNAGPLIEKAFAMAADRKLEPIHPFDDPLIIAGQGTAGLEIFEDLAGCRYRDGTCRRGRTSFRRSRCAKAVQAADQGIRHRARQGVRHGRQLPQQEDGDDQRHAGDDSGRHTHADGGTDDAGALP